MPQQYKVEVLLQIPVTITGVSAKDQRRAKSIAKELVKSFYESSVSEEYPYFSLGLFEPVDFSVQQSNISIEAYNNLSVAVINAHEVKEPSMKTYQFYLPEHGEDPTDATEFDVPFTTDNLNIIAEFAAQEFYTDHDGRYTKWPLEFTILDANGDELGTRKVQLKAQPPIFNAMEPAPCE